MSEFVRAVAQAIGATELVTGGCLRDMLMRSEYAQQHSITFLLQAAAKSAITAQRGLDEGLVRSKSDEEFAKLVARLRGLREA